MEIISDIPVNVDLAGVRRRLRLKRDDDLIKVQKLMDKAQDLIEARALYKVCFIEEKLDASVRVEGLCFKSKVLQKNLAEVERVFPYVVTIGNRLEEEVRNLTDLLEQYYLDTIGVVALTSARKYLAEELRSRYALGKIAFMSPGSLADWPIEEQKSLFQLLGDVESAIGVRLTNSFLMLPAKSVSGIHFPTEITFYSCQLCPRKDCVSRKAAYSKKLAGEYGILK